MYEIYETPEVKKNYSEIIQYYTEKLKNPYALVSLLEEIERCYERILEFPYSIPVCQEQPLKIHEYRKVLVKKYFIFYSVEEITKEVFIHYICHSRMNYIEFLL